VWEELGIWCESWKVVDGTESWFCHCCGACIWCISGGGGGGLVIVWLEMGVRCVSFMVGWEGCDGKDVG